MAASKADFFHHLTGALMISLRILGFFRQIHHERPGIRLLLTREHAVDERLQGIVVHIPIENIKCAVDVLEQEGRVRLDDDIRRRRPERTL